MSKSWQKQELSTAWQTHDIYIQLQTCRTRQQHYTLTNVFFVAQSKVECYGKRRRVFFVVNWNQILQYNVMHRDFTKVRCYSIRFEYVKEHGSVTHITLLSTSSFCYSQTMGMWCPYHCVHICNLPLYFPLSCRWTAVARHFFKSVLVLH
jgi:hypothetical protein